jgi:tetratricopeptide (TPR) repeat protein
VKPIISLLLAMFVANHLYAQDSTRFAAKAHGYEQEALQVYSTKPDTAIDRFKQAADLYKIAKNKKAAAICIQNAAYVHEAYRKDNYKAMELGKEAIALWKQTSDTKSTADAYRFLAAQHVKMNDNLNAMKRSDTAINYYTKLGDNGNIATVNMSLVSLYEGQKNVDSAAKYAMKAREAGEKVKNSDSTMFHIDNALFRIYTVGNRKDEAKKMFKKLSKKVKKNSVPKADKLNFYYYAWVYHNKLNEAEEAAAYKKEYDELKKQQ